MSDKKQYVGFVRDHSGSMSSLRPSAMKDYNNSVKAVKEGAEDNDLNTVVTVVSIGVQGLKRHDLRVDVINSEVKALKPLTSYEASGGTPLFDGVGEIIEIFKKVPDYNDPNVTFLIMAITDGEENQSTVWKSALGPEVKKLQATDRWTFVFRVPDGYKDALVRLGVPSGNVQEWEVSERGLRVASAATTKAVSAYMGNVSRGIRSTQSFYVNADKIDLPTAAGNLDDISDEVAIYPVKDKTDISSFFTLKTKRPYKKGTGFYQLNKPEKAVQDYKIIVIRNQKNGSVFAGDDARQLLQLPTSGTISLKPGAHGEWDVFIQSTSTNRILVPGTSTLYWENA